MITFVSGRLHDFAPPPIHLAAYAEGPLPAPAKSIEPPQLQYPMAGNDTVGDCTIADAVHSSQVWSSITHEPWAYCGDAATVSEYYKLTGGQDTGLVISQLLASWHANGLGPVAHRITAYAQVHYANLVEVRQAVDWYGTCRIGVNLPQAAMDEFNAGKPWDLTGTAADDEIIGGHDVPIVGYDSELYVVTWGRIQPVTLRWFQRYVEEAWAIVPANFMPRHGDGRGINVAQLIADCTKLSAATAASHPYLGSGFGPGTVHRN
jgi:hypothetical protein